MVQIESEYQFCLCHLVKFVQDRLYQICVYVLCDFMVEQSWVAMLDADSIILRQCAMLSGMSKWLPVFQRSIVPSTSGSSS